MNLATPNGYALIADLTEQKKAIYKEGIVQEKWFEKETSILAKIVEKSGREEPEDSMSTT